MVIKHGGGELVGGSKERGWFYTCVEKEVGAGGGGAAAAVGGCSRPGQRGLGSRHPAHAVPARGKHMRTPMGDWADLQEEQMDLIREVV